MLNNDQQSAYDLIASGKNVFVSGPGGVGKSYLIDHIRSRHPNTVIVAPTGIAALNVSGKTIHSTFKMGLGVLTKSNASRGASDEGLIALFGPESNVKILIIDEISMCRQDVFYAIDRTLQKVRKNDLPFGGIQVVMFGDFFQIEPIVSPKDEEMFYRLYSSKFCFASESWASLNVQTAFLNKVVRQSDEVMIDNLQKIRQGSSDRRSAINYFNEYSSSSDDGIDNDNTILCTTNKTAEYYNTECYETIDEKEHIFNAYINGNFDPLMEPAPKELKIKEGTKVIITANDPRGKYVNGSVGYVVQVTPSALYVLLDPENITVKVPTFTWTQNGYRTNANGDLETFEEGTFEQIPVRHGWAITIHKSQGQTLSRAVIDLGRGCFAAGQAYVALSRLKNIEGMSFIRPLMIQDVITSTEVKEFYKDGARGNRGLSDIL